jgi:uncharacterized protein involved in response to NO
MVRSGIRAQRARLDAERPECRRLPPLRRRRDYDGPALFSYGFRPFFLARVSGRSLAIFHWTSPKTWGSVSVPTPSETRSEVGKGGGKWDWHVHRNASLWLTLACHTQLIAVSPAVPRAISDTGTGRLPVNGWPLARAVAALWLGRNGLRTPDFGAVLAALSRQSVDTAVSLSRLTVGRGARDHIAASGKNLAKSPGC